MFSHNLIRNTLLLCGLSVFPGCSRGSDVEREKHRTEYDQRIQVEAKEVGDAVKKSNNNEKEGFLDLYRIGINIDNKYSVEYQESANDALTELLLTKTELWVRTFSEVKDFKFNLGVLPQNISDGEYRKTIMRKLMETRWNKDEARCAEDVKRLLKI